MKSSFVQPIAQFALRAITVSILTTLSACNRTPETAGGSQAKPPPPVPVKVAVATQGDLAIEVRSVGNVKPIATVMLKPQTTAQVIELPVQEGQDVREGDVVMRLDSRPFESALRASEASLARSRVLAEDAKANAARMRVATESNAVPQRDADEAEAKAAAATAQAAADQAAVDTAKLNLEYCTIKAPFSGRLGALLVKRGAVVKENEAELVELTQILPIDVEFTITEDRLGAVRDAQAISPLRVDATIPGDPKGAIAGVVTFIDNKVDMGTGTVRVKGTFDNKDLRLWPGAFVNTILTIGRDTSVVLVPSQAVQATQAGRSVYVVKPNRTVDLRAVVVRRSAGDVSIIEKGIAPGETVVTDGQLRLVPGATVEFKQTAAPANGEGDAKVVESTPGKDGSR